MRCLRAESFLTFIVNNAPYGVRGRVVAGRTRPFGKGRSVSARTCAERVKL